MFRNQPTQRAIAAVVLTTFTSLALYPLTAAAQAKHAIEEAGLRPKQKDEGLVGNAKRYINILAGDRSPKPEPGADDQVAQLLNEIHDALKAVTPHTALPVQARLGSRHSTPSDDANHARIGGKGMETRAIGPDLRIETERGQPPLRPLPGISIGTEVKNIRAKGAEIRSLYPVIEQRFNETERHLTDAKLPQEILNRHKDAVAQYESRKAEFERLMNKVEQAAEGDVLAALADLGAFMAKYPNARPHQYTDPNKLPFRPADGKVRAPLESKAQYQARLFPPKYDKVMLASLSLDGVQLAQATLPNQPAAADLGETEDVQITQAIKDLAEHLDHNPVKIYNWVKNNIAFVPSYGSIQGSDLTLQHKRGNAFDTASLLIALYRAAGIPARYVYGTIEVPADKVMNWVGGVAKAEAAQNLLGQGGIPNIALVAGGTIKAIRMEHVWVEAYVDYMPSRGAVNKAADTWVAMDPSFKQYLFTPGLDIQRNVRIDAQAMVAQIQQGATINESEGWVQNLNQANLQSQISNYQDQVKAYVASQKPNASVDDMLGTQTIAVEERPILLGSLPYKTVAVGNSFQTLPDQLRWKFKTNIYAADGVSDGDSPIIELKQSTPKLGGKKITLSFVPATTADQDLINSYLPKPHADGTPIQPSELPTSLPGYLLKMKAELRVEGQIVAQTGGSFTMGGLVRQSNQYFNPATGTWSGGEDNDITVGEYNAIALDLQGLDLQQLGQLQTKLLTTKAAIDQYLIRQSDSTPIQHLTKEELAGDMMFSGIAAYFAEVDNLDRRTAQSTQSIISLRLPSYGRFFSAVTPRYYFGIVRSVTFPGVTMDVDYLMYQVSAKDADQKKQTVYMRQVGAFGSMAENTVPERIFKVLANSPDPLQGVSAVRALTVAAAHGQKIFSLNQQNQALHSSIVSSLLIGADAKQEIMNALRTGKEVTVHEKDLALDKWTGAGYIILDPDTGAGAYKIAGGENGGFAALSVFAWLFALIMVGTPLGIWAIYLGFVAGVFATALKCANSDDLGLLIATQMIWTLASLMFALLLVTLLVTGPLLIIALLMNSLVWRVIITWVTARQQAANGC